MEDEKTTDTQYIRRFNDGYVIAKYMPDLSEKLAGKNGETVGQRAMQDGRNQYLSEKVQEKLPSWLTRDPNRANSRLMGKGKDESIEPDR